ncbi:FG-GAP repeat domain-containing protein [Favolaschia claudopus]|uniref:FG-GAP repeat domain-containing protein n=1 Tax=Favolaschia claudopus TaxID=2862362 RepID=A0AAW0BRU6_9AGAR
MALLPASQAGFAGKSCRIMPLGGASEFKLPIFPTNTNAAQTASVTYGKGSTDGNGYRGTLYNLLLADGNDVDMVGSQKGGNMSDPDNEGYNGLIITEIDAKGNTAMPIYQPNIVAIVAGTNDMKRDIDVADAPNRLKNLIQDVLDASSETVVVVSTLHPNADPPSEERILAFNAALPDLVQSFVDAGKPVILVDSHAVIAVGDLVDGTHPNDAGYARMGKAFYDGIQEAYKRGWIFDIQ